MQNKYGHNRTTQKREAWNVRESQVKDDSNPTQRVDLSPADFDRLLAQKGVAVKIYRTTYCPKVKSVDGAEHEIDCQLCNGSGFVDLDPITTRAFIQNQGLENLAHVEGFVQGNTVGLTFPIGIEVQYFTKIELLDQSDIYFQRVLRRVGSLVDILKYRALRINLILDYNNIRYYPGQDFSIDVNGNVIWSGTRVPADEVIYTIHYETAVQYRAVTAIHANRFTQTRVGDAVEFIKMPEQWMAVKEFLVKRINLAGQETPQGPYDNHSVVV